MKSQLESLCEKHGVTADVKRGNRDKVAAVDDWMRNANLWAVTLKRGRKRMTVSFWTDSAAHKPTVADVLSSLCSDSSAYLMSFEEWCSELGFNTDSRRALETYRDCAKTGYRLQRFLGDLLRQFCDAQD